LKLHPRRSVVAWQPQYRWATLLAECGCSAGGRRWRCAARRRRREWAHQRAAREQGGRLVQPESLYRNLQHGAGKTRVRRLIPDFAELRRSNWGRRHHQSRRSPAWPAAQWRLPGNRRVWFRLRAATHFFGPSPDLARETFAGFRRPRYARSVAAVECRRQADRRTRSRASQEEGALHAVVSAPARPHAGW